jgi:hypothetical protein
MYGIRLNHARRSSVSLWAPVGCCSEWVALTYSCLDRQRRATVRTRVRINLADAGIWMGTDAGSALELEAGW